MPGQDARQYKHTAPYGAVFCLETMCVQDPPRAVPTPPPEGNRFVKTFVSPRLDRGNQVCTDKKHYDLGIRVKPEYDTTSPRAS